MLRYRVTSTSEVPVMLFSSAEALFIWHDDPNNDVDADITVLGLRPDDYMDVEWCGCEIVYQNGSYTIFNFVSVAFARQPDNGSGHVVKSFSGWVSEHVLPTKSTKTFTITRLNDDEGLHTSA